MLKLKLDDLAVDSFDTTPAAKADGGTVFGEQCTCPTNCSCPGCPTCDPSYCDTACWSCGGQTCEGATCEAPYDTCWDSCNTAC